MEDVILTKEQLDELNLFASQYITACEESATADANKKAVNAIIKNLLTEYGVSKFVTEDGIKFSMSVQHKVSFDEVKLLSFCKTLNIPGLVKTQEYVDMEVLESAIYNHKIEAESLKPYQVTKPDVVTLKYTQKKKLNE